MTTNRTEETTKGLRASRGATIGVIVVVCFLGWLFAEPSPTELDQIAEQSAIRLEQMQYTAASDRLESLDEKATAIGLTPDETDERLALIEEMDRLNKESEKRLRLE